MRLVTPQQMKLLEDLSDKSGVSYAQLMEHAGQQLSVFLLRQIRQKKDGKILFLCGNGNNGGDCFVAARLLSAQGVPVCVGLLCGIPKTILAYSMYKQLGDIPVVSSADQQTCDMGHRQTDKRYRAAKGCDNRGQGTRDDQQPASHCGSPDTEVRGIVVAQQQEVEGLDKEQSQRQADYRNDGKGGEETGGDSSEIAHPPNKI